MAPIEVYSVRPTFLDAEMILPPLSSTGKYEARGSAKRFKSVPVSSLVGSFLLIHDKAFLVFPYIKRAGRPEHHGLNIYSRCI